MIKLLCTYHDKRRNYKEISYTVLTPQGWFFRRNNSGPKNSIGRNVISRASTLVMYPTKPALTIVIIEQNCGDECIKAGKQRSYICITVFFLHQWLDEIVPKRIVTYSIPHFNNCYGTIL